MTSPVTQNYTRLQSIARTNHKFETWNVPINAPVEIKAGTNKMGVVTMGIVCISIAMDPPPPPPPPPPPEF